MPRVEFETAKVLEYIRENPPPELLYAYNPTTDDCPFCGKRRKIIWKTILGKKTPLLQKSICDDECLVKVVEEMIDEYPPKISIADLSIRFAIDNNLPNGQTIHYLDDHYRNNNLFFWDKQNQRVVHPFDEMDDYGSVPPIFPVGDGYFNPTDWLDEVVHNTLVFPSRNLINEMKNWAGANPEKNKMTVTINGDDYNVVYDPTKMGGKWDSCVLEVLSNKKGPVTLKVYPGEPIWRKNIVEDNDEENTQPYSEQNVALMELVAQHLHGKKNKNGLLEREIKKAEKASHAGTRKSKKNKRGTRRRR
jgi:hypothetical protein